MSEFAMTMAKADDITKDQLSFMAQTAETAERYGDMVVFMKELVINTSAKQVEMDVETRNLFSVAYKNEVGALRQSWRHLSHEECWKLRPGADETEADKTERETLEASKKQLVEKYRQGIAELVKKTCHEVISLLNKHCIKPDGTDEQKTQDPDTEVFYLKMVGDYYRYLCEVSENNENDLENGKKEMSAAYEKAKKKAEQLQSTNPTRLGLALNYAVAMYEITKKKDEAMKLAENAYNVAIEKLGQLNDAKYKDSTLIMQLLRDNLTIWKADDEENQPDPDQ